MCCSKYKAKEVVLLENYYVHILILNTSQTTMVYFFQAAVLSCSENAKFGPILAILAILLQIFALFCVLFTGPKSDKYQVC